MTATVEEVCSGIFVTEHRVAEGKNGVVIGTRRTLAIDTGTDAAEGQVMADLIRRHGHTPSWLAITHGHGDHAYGAAAFRAAGADVFAHVATEGVVRRGLTNMAERTGRSVEDVASSVAVPTVTFSDELRLDLGGRHVRLLHTPGHSADSACALVEEDGVLFGGDTAVTGIPPAFGDGNSIEMEASLRRLATLDAKVLVGGHGPVIRGADAVRDWLTWLADYLGAVRSSVRAALEAGIDPERVPAEVPFDHFIGNRLPADGHGMVSRHQNAVRQIVKEQLARANQ